MQVRAETEQEEELKLGGVCGGGGGGGGGIAMPLHSVGCLQHVLVILIIYLTTALAGDDRVQIRYIAVEEKCCS